MTVVKYIYDYPPNRILGRKLHNGDFQLIAEKTGYSRDYVIRVLRQGSRTNDQILKTAKRLISLKDQL